MLLTSSCHIHCPWLTPPGQHIYLPHRYTKPDTTELEQGTLRCKTQQNRTLMDGEWGPLKLTLAKLLIWQNSGFPKRCKQIFAHIVEFTSASALGNVWFHSEVFQSWALLHLFSLHQQKCAVRSSAALLAETELPLWVWVWWDMCLPNFNRWSRDDWWCRGWG